MNEHAEPHFDDERTLIAARPVVPLETIEWKARHRRRWFLGGAFAIAMMLGAASALVASYLKLRNVPQTATELSVEPQIAAAPVAVAETESTDTTVVQNEDTAVVENVEENTTPPVTAKKESPRHRALATRPAPEPY